jgi:hypothetical protein
MGLDDGKLLEQRTMIRQAFRRSGVQELISKQENNS